MNMAVHKVTDGFYEEHRRMKRKLDSIKGPDVTNTPEAIYIGRAPTARRAAVSDDPPSPVVISGKITGNASGNGKYTGKSFADVTADVSASGNLAEADFGTLAAANDCLVLNGPELGVSNTGHDVTAATNTAQFSLYFTGRLVRVNSDGTKVVHAQLFWVGC